MVMTAVMYLAMWKGLFVLRSSLIIATIVIVFILLIQGFEILLPKEVRVYLELGKKEPDNEKIVRLGLRNIKLAGVQVMFQIAIIFVMANLAFARGEQLSQATR
jgi:hypothetical protein